MAPLAGKPQPNAAMNWDAGITLCGREGENIRPYGSGDSGTRCGIGRSVKFDRTFFREALTAVRWQFPVGVHVEEIHFLSKDTILGLPVSPPDVERIILVSPFLDRQVVLTAGTKWGGAATKRALLSTPGELARIAIADRNILSPFAQTRILSRPEEADRATAFADPSSDAAQTAEQLTEEEATIPEGLHAKLIYFGKKNSHTLWIGSANGSQRAWTGKNFEVVAKLSVSSEHVEALEAFVASGQDFNATDAQAVEPDAIEEALEAARKQIASDWDVRQRFEDNQPVLVAKKPLALSDSRIVLDVAVLGQTWNRWPSGAQQVRLPAVRPWERTELIQIRLTLETKSCAWLQSAPFVEEPLDRDKEVISQYLDTRSFLLWVRSALDGDPVPPDGIPWNQPPSKPPDPPGPPGNPPSLDATPTIEEILKAWARAPQAFAVADVRVTSYLAAQRDRALESGRKDDVRLLNDFSELWQTLKVGLAASSL